MAYALGAVKPHVKVAAETLGPKYGITTIIGVAWRAYDSDHPKGLALDFMTREGTALAEDCRQNHAAYSVSYVIWRQAIWSPERADEGWRPMKDRGGDSANHMDHVHVSFKSKGSFTDVGWKFPGSGGGSRVESLISSVTSPEFWKRVAWFSLGAILIYLALRSTIDKLAKVGSK